MICEVDARTRSRGLVEPAGSASAEQSCGGCDNFSNQLDSSSRMIFFKRMAMVIRQPNAMITIATTSDQVVPFVARSIAADKQPADRTAMR